MHHIYHTKALILGSREFGEAGKYYFLLTRELGLVYARAQGVRKLSSKLRYVLQDFSYVNVDLVRGREFWQVTSASKTNELETLVQEKVKFKIFINIARLSRRLLSGEEGNEKLFDDLVNSLKVLEVAKTKEEIQNIEILAVLRILNNLGYIGEAEKLSEVIHSPLSDELLGELKVKRKLAIGHINKALRETQL